MAQQEFLRSAIKNTALTGEVCAQEISFLNRLAGENNYSQGRLALRRCAGAGPVVVYVHGSTFPSALSVAWCIEGHSWMDALADAGFDAWAFDFLGYGLSDRPSQFDELATTHSPLGKLADVTDQLSQVLRAIRNVRLRTPLYVIAHSWGSLPAQAVAAEHPDLIDRLVLFGPLAWRNLPPGQNPLQAWSLITCDMQRIRFTQGVPSADVIQITEPELDRWCQAYLESDPSSANRTPPSVKIPGGPSADIADLWSGCDLVEVSRIRQPVLIVRGAWDMISTDDDAAVLMAGLKNAASREDIIIPRGTHLLHLEYQRTALWSAVNKFLAAR